MKSISTRLMLVGSVATAFFHLCGHARAAITNYSVNFNGGESSYTGNFVRAGDAAVTGFSWLSNGGTGGGGGLQVTNTTTNNIFYRPSPVSDATSTFDFSSLTAGTGFVSSADFRWSDTLATGLTSINLGFSSLNPNNALSAGDYLSGSLIRNGTTDVTLRLRTGSDTPFSLAFDQSALTEDSWYRLVFQAQKTATTNIFSTLVTLYSIGADGTSSPVLFNDGSSNIQISGNISNSTLYTDTTVFGAYDVRNTNGIDRIDNLSVAFIPEPSSLLLTGAAFAFLGVRRRQRAQLYTTHCCRVIRTTANSRRPSSPANPPP